MLAQYHHFKSIYKDCLLLFRLGDFYELFYEDAVVGSRELNLVLTSRPAGKGKERIPMCGVPYHSASGYIHKLLRKGYKVAVCEQVEEASKAKGPVRREVVRVITPGTYFEKEGQGLACLYPKGPFYYVSYMNLAVGEFLGSKIKKEELADFLSKFNVGEVLVKDEGDVPEDVRRALGFFVTELGEEFFEEGEEEFEKVFGPFALRALGFQDGEMAIALGTIHRYVRLTQKGFMPYVGKPRPFTDEGFVRIDLKARKGLELVESIEGKKEHSLFGVLDRTLTGMGRRRLRFHLLNPFRDTGKIRRVQEAVEELVENSRRRERIREILRSMADLERLVSRISSGMATPRDILHLKNTLFKVEELREELKDVKSEMLADIRDELQDLGDIAREIDRVLTDDPPLHVKEGNLIKEGVDALLDELRHLRDNARRLVESYERKLREETGIQSLKVGYNKVMGYYIQVTKPNLRYVPSYFRRRQTLSGAERFTTDELTSLEEKILSAQSKINELEYQIFTRLRERIVEELSRIATNARLVGEVDYVQSLAEVAYRKGWVKPEVHEGYDIEIEKGRHPVIEEFRDNYVSNDTKLTQEEFIHIVTGPNMAGKSSYIRQTALITLLAHMGSFVPADRAKVGNIDAIFTRIGSGDLLSMGVSTFMNEMLDVASILGNATRRSLIILDEVGRGTSTYDGIAITKALVEYISSHGGAKTLLATHFLEITRLEGRVRGVKNYHMAVKKDSGGIVFLYTLVPGKAEGSFGVEVARMAGLPEELMERAMEILRSLEEPAPKPASPSGGCKELVRYILSIDIANTTPLQALLKLAELKEIAERFGRS